MLKEKASNAIWIYCCALSLILAGCATGRDDGDSNLFTKYYQPTDKAIAIIANRAGPPSPQPIVMQRAQYDEAAIQAYFRKGYVLIGHSDFASTVPPSPNEAVAQAVSVGADLVEILSPAYLNSTTTITPTVSPTMKTATTNGTALAFGSGGEAFASGNSTTTTIGTTTTYTPTTVHRYVYHAGYFVKKKFVFGAAYRDLTDSERQQLQTNRGVVVTTIVDDSPAYNSDIFNGDVILQFNGIPVRDFENMNQLIAASAGTTVDVELIRAGVVVAKRVTLSE